LTNLELNDASPNSKAHHAALNKKFALGSTPHLAALVKVSIHNCRGLRLTGASSSLAQPSRRGQPTSSTSSAFMSRPRAYASVLTDIKLTLE
jgi:hypothetical protein